MPDTPTPPPAAPPQKNMHQADIDLDSVQSIGKHCDLPSCHRLDFLPFKCESCSGTYCLDHRTETAHKCAHEGRWASLCAPKSSSTTTTASTPKPRSLLEGPCARPSCKTTINTVRDPGVNCITCRRTYCLAHRLQDSHNCDSIKPASTGSSSTVAGHDMAKAALSRFKAWTASKKETLTKSAAHVSSSSRAPNPVVELAKLRRTAKGDEKIPADKRVYVYVEAEAKSTSSKLPRGEFWYGKDWTVGRVLDKAAQGLQVANVNNRDEGEEKKLRVFHVEGGRMLEFGEKLGDVVVSGNTLVLLRGVKIVDLLVEE